MKTEGSGHKISRNVKGIVIKTAILFFVVIISFLIFWSSCPLPAKSPPSTVLIEQGSSTRDIANILMKSGIIRSPFLFRVLAKLIKADGKMQAGEFSFESGLYLWDIISNLIEGKGMVYRTLTIKEGKCVEEIATLIDEKGYGDRARFLEIAKDPTLVSLWVEPDQVSDLVYPVEGYLFPDTYNIQSGMSEEQLVFMMINRFSEIYTKDLEEKTNQLGLTVHQVSTLASIVEKEAVVDEERSIIAAVFLNRVKIGMTLGADPTVLYALGRFNGTLLLKELDIDSPYNTYKNVGLPPGPISNFGKASLEAVLNPADVDYLYFVSKNDGTHAFSHTLLEHNRNVKLYQ